MIDTLMTHTIGSTRKERREVMNSKAQGSNKPGTDSDRKSNICSEDFTVIKHVCQVITTRKETGCGTTEIARQGIFMFAESCPYIIWINSQVILKRRTNLKKSTYGLKLIPHIDSTTQKSKI